MKMLARASLLCGAAISAIGASAPASAQSVSYFLFDGDSSRGVEIQNGSVVNAFDTFSLGYPVAITDTIWLGHRDNQGGVQYNLDGSATGATSSAGSPISQLLDGTTNGLMNFGVTCCAGTNSVTSANLDWTDQTTLFNIAENGWGIAYGATTDSLYVSTSTSIINYALDGTILGEFSVAGFLAGLAYDGTSNSLWGWNRNDSSLEQYALDGTLLQDFAIDVATHGIYNPFGGEIAFAAAPAVDTEDYIDINTAFGTAPNASGVDAIAIGNGAQASGNDAVAIGRGSNAVGQSAVAMGALNTSSGTGAVSMGNDNFASGVGAVAIGNTNEANGDGALAQGNTNIAGGPGAVALGNGNTATGTGATALGNASVAGGPGAVAIGNQGSAIGDGAVAIGNMASSGTDGVAIGNGASTAGRTNSVAIGAGSVNTANNQVAVGGQSAATARTVTGVAAGTGTYDAVNVGQMNAAVAGLNASLDGLQGDVDTLFDLRGKDRRDMKQGIAAAVAMSNAPMPSAPGRVSYVVNGSAFRGEYAVGGSMQYRLNTESPMAVGVGFSYGGNKNNAVRVGVSGEF